MSRVVLFPVVAVCLVFIVLLTAMSAQTFAADEQPAGAVVVELFTSQGCSSCPPADQLLAGLSEIADKHQLPVYCLSFHVDYWNSLGWHDPYSSKQFTGRQHRYAAAFESRRVYTPQMIVNGETEFVGSRAKDARAAIETELSTPSKQSVTLTAAVRDDRRVKIDYVVVGHDTNTVLNVAIVQRQVVNRVPRGENTGRELAHVGVVRSFETVQIEKPTGTLNIKLPSNLDASEFGVVAYVQDPRTMRIGGASAVEL